jgi:DNA-directed RNA polymerase subunit H (RpoH/RPB5)
LTWSLYREIYTKMDFETLDVIYKSRQTLLKILKDKGYNTKPYEKFGPFEIEMMISSDKEHALNMELTRELPEDSTLPRECLVEYAIPRVKSRLAGFIRKLLVDDETGKTLIDPKKTEIVVITLEPIGDTFHVTALNQWAQKNIRISFFDAHALTLNPLDHMLVPKHEIVPEDQHAELLKMYNMTSKLNLPVIRFHEDPIARILGLTPGSIVKITRPSPSAGVYTLYRVCTP